MYNERDPSIRPVTCHTTPLPPRHNFPATVFPPKASSFFIFVPFFHPKQTTNKSETLTPKPSEIEKRRRRCQGGTKEASTTATKPTPGTTFAAKRQPPPPTTPSSRSSRNSSETSRPTTMSSLTERAFSTTPSSSSSTWKTSTPSIPIFPPNSALRPPIFYPWYTPLSLSLYLSTQLTFLISIFTMFSLFCVVWDCGGAGSGEFEDQGGRWYRSYGRCPHWGCSDSPHLQGGSRLNEIAWGKWVISPNYSEIVYRMWWFWILCLWRYFGFQLRHFLIGNKRGDFIGLTSIILSI